MLNEKVLECLEQNVEGLEKIQNLMRYEYPLIYSDLMMEIEIDHFRGYEALLPVLMLSTDDPAIDRTTKRLLLQLYSEKLQSVGGREMVDRVRSMLLEEQEDWLKRVGRIKELRNQKRI